MSLLLWLSIAPSAQEQRPRPALPEGTVALRDVEYVPRGHERQKLDVYVPRSASAVPLVVWIHGGAWQGGSKERPKGIGFLSRGYAVASVNYRFSQHAPFPAQLEDCKAAVRWLRANAQRLNIDPDRIGVWGHSAGGHLAALLGTTGNTKAFDVGPNLAHSSRVQAVCDWSGPTDLGLYGRSGPEDVLGRLIGGPIQDNRARVARANPITYVSRGVPPFLITHGDRDGLVPLKHSELLAAALRRVGGEVTLRVVRGAGHDPAEPDSNQKVMEFFDRHLRVTRRAPSTITLQTRAKTKE